jgi:hypothetical protein
MSEGYKGVEQGPIRPPSEAASLLIRVTRNCPWNRCRFCPVYKGTSFSRRPLADVLRDIDLIADSACALLDRSSKSASGRPDAYDPLAFQIAHNWVAAGARSVFLQDSDAFVARSGDLLQIVRHLKQRMPWVERITSYARSRSILRMDENELGELRSAGLSRIHIGFESGSDEVLASIDKGATKAEHAEAGRRVKQAGMELSAYYMPGLGGRRLLRENALETASLVNQVVPDFLRLRALAVPDHVPLAEDIRQGTFEKANDVEVAEEILLFLKTVGDIACELRSDHILNLFQDLEGSLAKDRGALIAMVERFLALEPDEQRLYRIGRRRGVFAGVDDMEVPFLRGRAEHDCERLGVTADNIDALVDAMTKRFV